MGPRGVLIVWATIVLNLTGCGLQGPDSSSGNLRAEPKVGAESPAGYEEEVRAALARCWTIDPEAPPIAVTLDVSFRRDRTVLSVTVVDQDRYGADPSFRDAADRARRAVLNPQCQPLPLPDDLWPSWREVTLRFDPRPRPDGS